MLKAPKLEMVMMNRDVQKTKRTNLRISVKQNVTCKV